MDVENGSSNSYIDLATQSHHPPGGDAPGESRVNMLCQNDLENFMDLVERGEISADEANVEMVRAARVKIVVNPIPRNVRKALNDAVKKGKLGHYKKDGKKPEVYFHPNFDYLARSERNKVERKIIESLTRTCI